MPNQTESGARSPGWKNRRRRIQGEIVERAMLLFEEHGYEDTTVQAIADATLISPRTFYRYFPAKEDVVFHGFPDSVDLLRREVRRSQGELLERLRQASVQLAGVLESDRDAWIRRFALILAVPGLRARDIVLNERYEEVFREAMLEEWGRGAESLRRSRLLAGSIMGGIQTAIKMWVANGGHPALPSLAGSVFDALHSAVDAPGPGSAVVRVEPHSSPRPIRDQPGAAPRKAPRRRPRSDLDFLD